MPQAKESPEYLKTSVIYQMLLRTFTPEGTLNAAAKLLPHLAEIGVDIVYLCPIVLADDDMDKAHWSNRQLKSGVENPKNPYRIKDYFHIDPEYGTDDDFLAFVNVAHQLGLSVMMDLVYFHCGPTAPLITDHPDFVQRLPDGSINCGEWKFPRLNFDNQELRDFLIENMIYFVDDFGVDGFRCDVATGIPIDFWEEAVEELQNHREDIIMLSEGDRVEDQLIAFDINYAFGWGLTIPQVLSGELPATALKEKWHYFHDNFPKGARFMRFLDNHDVANDSYDNRLEKRFPLEANDAALVLNFTVDGIPFLYNGQEIADATRHILFGNRFTASNNCINWSKLLTSEGQARLELIKTLTELKHEATALSEGDLVWIDNSEQEHVLSFLRACGLEDDCEEDDCCCDDECSCHHHEDEDDEEEEFDDDEFDDDEEFDDDDDDDCDCGHDHHHHDATQMLVVVNLSDKPLVSRLDIQVERGTLLKTRLAKDASYKLLPDHYVQANLLPWSYLILEF